MDFSKFEASLVYIEFQNSQKPCLKKTENKRERVRKEDAFLYVVIFPLS